MKQVFLLLLALSLSGSVVYGQVKTPTPAASKNTAEFVLRIQFDSQNYQINSKIAVGETVSSPVDMNGLNPDVELFDLISEHLMAPRNGVYPVSLTPIMLNGGGCSLCGTAVLMLTPDKPYQWRVAPKGSVYYTVTLMTVKTTNKT